MESQVYKKRWLFQHLTPILKFLSHSGKLGCICFAVCRAVFRQCLIKEFTITEPALSCFLPGSWFHPRQYHLHTNVWLLWATELPPWWHGAGGGCRACWMGCVWPAGHRLAIATLVHFRQCGTSISVSVCHSLHEMGQQKLSLRCELLSCMMQLCLLTSPWDLMSAQPW